MKAGADAEVQENLRSILGRQCGPHPEGNQNPVPPCKLKSSNTLFGEASFGCILKADDGDENGSWYTCTKNK